MSGSQSDDVDAVNAANVTATKGEMSTWLFRRDHAHESQSARRVAFFTAVWSSGWPR
jgi:hypothetical protein